MTKVIVFGASGLLGASLCPYLSGQGYDVVRAGRSSGQDYILDVSDASSIKQLLQEIEPQHIVNLVGATNVDQCESDVSFACAANTMVPQAINAAIGQCEDLNVHLVHISTDHVYDGAGPHDESVVNPINVYALSKLAGELLVDLQKTAVLRTNFYGKSLLSGRISFSDWIVASLRKEENITLFQNVMFSALNIDTLCEIIDEVMRKRVVGTFNVGCRNGVSKADFGLALAKQLGIQVKTVKLGNLENLMLKAKRPLDMTMNVQKLEAALGRPCPDIFDEVNKTAKEYSNE